MGAADGGQILASSIVRGLVAGRDYAFSDRGSEQLKGLAEPLHLCEVDWSLGSAT
jgi:class 3 adenylate cyclase